MFQSMSSTLDDRLSGLPSLICDESRQKFDCLKSMRCLRCAVEVQIFPEKALYGEEQTFKGLKLVP